MKFIIRHSLNAISLFAAVYMVYVAAQTVRSKVKSQEHSNSRDPIALEGVSWSNHRQTLLLVLQVGCRYCTESAPFYRRLLAQAESTSTHVIAVFPNTIPGARKYLSLNSLDIEDVRSADIGVLKIRATPTVILADNNGVPRSIWEGRLPSEKENEIIRQLGLSPEQSSVNPPQFQNSSPVNIVSPLQFKNTDKEWLVVDTRDRSEYSKIHIHGSINIPLDELESRACPEVPDRLSVVIYCYEPIRCINTKQGEHPPGACMLASKILLDQTQKVPKVLFSSPAELVKVHIPLGGTARGTL